MQNDGAVMGTHHLMCTHCFNVFLHDLAPPNDSEVMGGSSALRQSGSTEYSQVDTLGLWYKFVNSGVKRSGLTKLARPIHTETQPDPLCHLSTPLPRGRLNRLLSFVAQTKKMASNQLSALKILRRTEVAYRWGGCRVQLSLNGPELICIVHGIRI